MRKLFRPVTFILALLASALLTGTTIGQNHASAFDRDSILERMYQVNGFFIENQWMEVDRNWIRATYFTGLMAFYRVTGDTSLLAQARNWSARHGWRTGTEWFYPANRMTCVQTYLELFFIQPDDSRIRRAMEFMDDQITDSRPANNQGWDYVDALYVGTPAYIMMSEATGNAAYAAYGNRMFRDVCKELYDPVDHLFYRDKKAKSEMSRNNFKVFWSRGNGWAFASIPRILGHLPVSDTNYSWYVDLFRQMAASLRKCQGVDGFWRTNLADPVEFPNPESSGTAFFTFSLAWGINHGLLERETYEPVVKKAWNALYSCVDDDGKVGWGQKVARKPEVVDKEDSDEFVAGAFLLAGSEMLKSSNSIKAGDSK